MQDPITSNIQISLNVPSQHIVCAAQDVLTHYTPIVTEACNNIRTKLYFDEEYKEYLTQIINERVEEIVKESVEKAVKSALNQAFYKNQAEIEKTVSDILAAKLEQPNKE